MSLIGAARRLWKSALPEPVRKNITTLGMFVLSEICGLMTKPTLNQLKAVIKVNRGIAAGLRGKA